MPEICNTLTFGDKKIDLVEVIPEKVVCAYTSPKLSDKNVIFSAATVAIASIANELLGEAGKEINAQEALNSITQKIEALIPALTLLKIEPHIELMQVIEIHPIELTSFTIALTLERKPSIVGSVHIDGVGFRIKIIKKDLT
jgi:hypothetical protein